jgi:hypothetical protein
MILLGIRATRSYQRSTISSYQPDVDQTTKSSVYKGFAG